MQHTIHHYLNKNVIHAENRRNKRKVFICFHEKERKIIYFISNGNLFVNLILRHYLNHNLKYIRKREIPIIQRID